MRYDKMTRLASPPARPKPKDNLALDVLDAEAAGMSYGKYKALHPSTKDTNEARLEMFKKHMAPAKTKEKICTVCGKAFIARFSACKYCSEACKEKNDNERYRKNKQKQKKAKEEAAHATA